MRGRRRRLGGLLQRHQPAPLEAAQRRVVAAGDARDRGGAGGTGRPAPRATARWRSPSRLRRRRAPPRRRRSARPQRPPRPQRPRRARCRCRAAAPAPARARAWRRTRRRPRGRAGPAPPGRRPRAPTSGSTSRSAGTSLVPARSTTTPSRRRRPNGTTQHAADAHARQLLAEQVVERPAQGARGRERLDLGDHLPDATREAGRRSAGAPPAGRRP